VRPGGRFVRKDTQFRNWLTSDGHPGPTGMGQSRRPWAHRRLIFRKLKRLENLVSLSVVHWLMGADGWTFTDVAGVKPGNLLSQQQP
jgi:glutathionyl-hydroquinone reductase